MGAASTEYGDTLARCEARDEELVYRRVAPHQR